MSARDVMAMMQRGLGFVLGGIALTVVTVTGVSVEAQQQNPTEQTESTEREDVPKPGGASTETEAVEGEARAEIPPAQLERIERAEVELESEAPNLEVVEQMVREAMGLGPMTDRLQMLIARVHVARGRCATAAELLEGSGASAESGPEPAEIAASAHRCAAAVTFACASTSIESMNVDGRGVSCGERAWFDAGSLTVEVGYTSGVTSTLSVDPGTGLDRQIDIPHHPAHLKALERSTTGLRGALLAAGATAEHIATERATAEASRRVEAERDAGIAPNGAAQTLEAQISTAPETEPALHLQFSLLAPTGLYALQRSDGLADLGYLFGGAFDAVVARRFTGWVWADLHTRVSVVSGKSLLQSRLRQRSELSIEQTNVRAVAEVRTWLGFVGISPLVDVSSRRVETAEETRRAATVAAGLGATVTTSGIDRRDGYTDFYFRWAPLFGGSAATWSAGLQTSLGFLLLDIAYDRFDSSSEELPLRRGESLFLSLGVRIPLALGG